MNAALFRNRVTAVFRLHLLALPRWVTMLWGILTLVWAISAGLLASFKDGPSVVIVGGLFSLYITLFLATAQTVTRVLPLALTMGATRSAYYVGTCLYLGVHVVASATLLATLRAVEQGTGGWGSALHFFDVPYLVGGNAPTAALAYAGSLAFVCGLGLACAAVTRRWGAMGTSVLSGAAAVVPGVAAWWIVQAGWWPAIHRWFRDQPELALQSFWPAVLAVALTGLSWFTLRRTPA